MRRITQSLIDTKKSIDKFVSINKKDLIKYIDSRHPSLQYFNYPLVDISDHYNVTKGKYIHEVIIRSFIAANQQFCFWYDERDSNKRTNYTSSFVNNVCYTSSDYKDLAKRLKDGIIKDSILLREERLDILQKSLDHAEFIPFDIFNFDDILNYLYNFTYFQHDLFRKKANYFIMDLIRYYKFVKKDENKNIFDNLEVGNPEEYRNSFIDFMETAIIPYHMPAIDYQIPRGLRSLGIIKLPNEFETFIKNEVILKNSTLELMIRSISYLTLNIIHNKVRYNKTLEFRENLSHDKFKLLKFSDLGILHEEIDSNLFFNRDQFILPSHMCVTTYY